MIDKITSRLSTQKVRPQSGEDDEELEKDELQIIDEILATSRRHPLAELPPAPHGLSPLQVCVAPGLNLYLFITIQVNVHLFI